MLGNWGKGRGVKLTSCRGSVTVGPTPFDLFSLNIELIR
jgi:hypothetical protein